ncbi:MAG: hypothetical protein LBB41_07075 [Prevotellaceae bacterium]|jgi:uncharacterized membrane protein HdeD (DUF308 family)|nr:hypothetical protein [Prevotellaceae bacterium]
MKKSSIIVLSIVLIGMIMVVAGVLFKILHLAYSSYILLIGKIIVLAGVVFIIFSFIFKKNNKNE